MLLFKKLLPVIKSGIAVVVCLVLIVSCNQTASTKSDNKETKTNIDTVIAKAPAKEEATTSIPPITAIPDSGKARFRVAVYKNNEVFTTYEGDWAIALQSGNLMSIQFPATPRMMKIAHGMIMYFNSPSVGTFPVVKSGNEKQKPVIIFTPEIDGAYGIGVSAESGTVTITKYDGPVISGTINAVGKDADGNTINIQAAFIHVKNNISD